jgi:hypothetical protein
VPEHVVNAARARVAREIGCHALADQAPEHRRHADAWLGAKREVANEVASGKATSRGDPMSWQPGQPVTTEQDRQDWERWRKESKREAQRWRRALYARITPTRKPMR